MRLLASLLVLIGTVLVAQCPQGSDKLKQHRSTTPTHYSNIVLISERCGLCTGFVIAKGVFATASHCVGPDMTATFKELPGSPTVPLKLVLHYNYERYQNKDIAILTGDTLGQEPLTLAGPEPLETCTSVGYGGSERHQKSTSCKFSGITDAYGTDNYIGDIDHGDSGGPILNARGQVIGIQVRLSRTFVFYAVPAKEIQEAFNLSRWLR